MKIYSCWEVDDTGTVKRRRWFHRKKDWQDFSLHEDRAGRPVLNAWERDSPTNAEGWVELLNEAEGWVDK